ncbi:MULTISPECIES: alpha/beta hydrolase [unclassified Pseudomonas]|uniref:alpha/beta hydrolase n=1 Tax=unclassified Pseudomonas TaxID=196821 RepID=UPI00041B21FA|nr:MULTISPECIES: alpha/beta hydrolase [unclassified Pseudomonas]ATP47368.1 alpha/beta hydrolase [Pseudomonas putida]SME92018.1 Lysophospholipase, alpha-beta hydrolase superfamily [Pseudomonas sp. LAIL14HWK12:I11]SMR68398.1 Lysophospholipase, alpha-beta hydrolase superfamily [Pseudomonas sp. LAIL14HWK12:I10]SOD00630.1 Lysophospholipase, alpha-beta hydrolase superfamily [Pseudomonas sp. LAIL14HWK12:I8]
MPAALLPDLLRASLAPLTDRQPLSAQGRDYQHFYGLDLPVHSWLGGFQAAGFELVGQVWLPPQPVATVFLLHGYYDHMGLYRHVIEWALGQGYAVISCDLPGHGLSSGERASISDFSLYQQVLDALFEQARRLGLPRPWHLCGQSTGGAIVVDHLLHRGEQSPADGQVILLAPLVRPCSWRWSKLSYCVLRHFVNGIERRFSENTNDPAFLAFLEADPLQPRRLPTAWVGALIAWVKRIEAAPRSTRRPLIVQGEADGTVDWPYNLEVLKAKFTEPQILMLPEARHHLANELPGIRQRYFTFIDQRLG